MSSSFFVYFSLCKNADQHLEIGGIPRSQHLTQTEGKNPIVGANVQEARTRGELTYCIQNNKTLKKMEGRKGIKQG